jgi:predicted nucleotidyltransferase component of viral defense system
MDAREICAEKIRAMSERARYRDFYDLMLLFENFKFDITEIKDLIGRKEARSDITVKSMLKNWAIARLERKEEIGRIYYAKEISGEEVIALIKKLNVNVRP